MLNVWELGYWSTDEEEDNDSSNDADDDADGDDDSNDEDDDGDDAEEEDVTTKIQEELLSKNLQPEEAKYLSTISDIEKKLLI